MIGVEGDDGSFCVEDVAGGGIVQVFGLGVEVRQISHLDDEIVYREVSGVSACSE